MKILAQIAGGFATISNIIGIQLKTKSQILISYIIACIFFIISFSLLKAYTGVVTCTIMMFITIIMYFMDKYNLKVKLWLILVLIIISIGISSLFYENWIDILSITSCVPFILMSSSKKEKNVRLFTFVFLLFYTSFDILVEAYAAFVGDILFLASTIFSIVRQDIIKKEKRTSKSIT